MGKDYQYKMDTALKNNKGFSILEMLVCMCFLSIATLLTVSQSSNLDLSHCYFLDDYLCKQSEAIVNREDITVGKGIRFNNMGHVNQARTVDFDNHSIVIHLGSGYATKK